MTEAPISISSKQGKKIYFCSDQHLGAPTPELSKERELKFVCWLEAIETDLEALFVLGDLFDFWFEYKKVVPKGFTRVLGTLARLSDQGIPIYFFVGNHDLWMRDYFEKELGIQVFFKPQLFVIDQKRFYIGHGDGLGPGDRGYKMMKKVFTNKICQWAYRWLHPDIGVALAQHLSVKNKLISGAEDIHFLGEDKEWLVVYCKEKLKSEEIDYFVFGHRHLPLEIQLNNTAWYINLGDWITHFTYGVYTGEQFELSTYQKD